jgi:hypothetical protein
VVAASANEKSLPVSAPPAPKTNNSTNTDYDNSEHGSTERSLFDRLSSTHQMQGGPAFPSPAHPAPPPPPLATNAKEQVEYAVEEESADLRGQMHQLMDGFRLQLDAQRARQQAVESEQNEAMAAQAASITALPHHVEDKLVAGQQAVTTLLHVQFE